MAPNKWVPGMSASALSLLLVLLHVVLCSARGGGGGPRRLPLARKVSPMPAAYNWTRANAWANDPSLTPLFHVLKAHGIPQATMGYRLNPRPDRVSLTAPAPPDWNNPEAWWMAGFGIDYRSPLRVASVTKPLTVAVWASHLNSLYGSSFFSLWTDHVGSLPEPRDARVKRITVQHLLDHKSGFDNARIGFDPAFRGKPVADQIGDILRNTNLIADPGLQFSYSNFGFMILAELAEAIRGMPFTEQIRGLFPSPSTIPVFGASDYFPVPAAGAGVTAEPSVYYIQSPDGPFTAAHMKGNGNVVSNVATLTWFATQYNMGGPHVGRRISAAYPAGRGATWIMNGAMPGTMSVLVQYVTPGKRIASFCVLINTRVPNASVFLTSLNDAAMRALHSKFKDS